MSRLREHGWVVYEVERGLPTVEYGEYGQEVGAAAYVERQDFADRFECGVCRLKLDRGDYLAEAAIPIEIEMDADDATQEEIDEYEAAQVDRYIDSMIDEMRGK